MEATIEYVYPVEHLLELVPHFKDQFEGIEKYKQKNPMHQGWRKSEPKFKVTWLLQEDNDLNSKIVSQVQKILNKISESNYETLLTELKNVNITNYYQLDKMVDIIFEKAVLEMTYTTLYAKICKEFIPYYVQEEDKKIYFRSILVELCKKTLSKYFNVTEKLPIDREAPHLHRLLGCVGFTGELFNIGLIPDEIIYKIFLLLKSKFNKEDYYVVEAFTKLYTCVGEKFFEKSPKYAHEINELLTEFKFASHITKKNKFTIVDALMVAKKNKWIKNN